MQLYMLGPLFYLIVGKWLLDVRAENGSEQFPRPLHINFYAERSLKTSLMDVMLQLSAREGLDAMLKQYAKTDANKRRADQFLSVNHPGAMLSKFSSPEMGNERTEMAAFATLSAAKAFRKHYAASNDFGRQAHPQKISLRRTALEALCPPRDSPKCVPASERYRTHDGTCNNKRRPRWGAAQMPFNRFLPPEFGDGVESIRKSLDGTPLSSSRFVSLLVHGAKKGEASITLLTAQWGQLLDHDMTATAQPRPINGSVPSCCGSNDFHPSCFPIKVPLDDPWLAPLKVRCLEFLRSAAAQRPDCVLSWREQTNQATAFIDASPIYSNSARLSDNTRTFLNGSLIFGRGNPKEDVCQRGALATQCIRSGDGRSGEQPGLLALHQVWVGEHNRIAEELSAMNTHWSDEKVYQESRRIVGAMFQHITYREFLPIVLGREVCKLFDLELLKTDFYKGYDPKVNPTIANAFSAAAFRFGHSLIQDSYMRCDRQHNVISNNVSLHEEFQRGDIGSVGSLHRLLRGLATQRALKRDEFITPELTNHLFQTPGFPFGLDLAAINIQRGRDHGIAPYTAWRVPCGLTPIQNWDDLSKVVGPESSKRISHAYRSVHDIDLFVGGISERPVVGGLVGPTFACIIAQQFSNTRKGDRFWYENGDMESSFTPAQLQSIRQVLFSQILCRAVGEGTFQTHIFIPADVSGNERQICGQGPLASINLKPWKEQDLPIESQASEQNFQTIIPEEKISTKIPTRQTNKGNKIGFQNRMPMPVKDKMTALNRNTINPSSLELQLKNMTKINDKLDIKRKQTHTKRPKPILGVDNKIDKGNKIISNVHRTQNQRPKRRRVIINNVPMELRSVPPTDNTPSTDSTLKVDLDSKTFTKARTNNEEHRIRKLFSTKSTDHFLSQFSNISDLDPLRHASAKENIRVQRKLDNSKDDMTLQTHFSNRTNKGLLSKIENSTNPKTLGFVPEPKQYSVHDYSTPRYLQKSHADDYEIEISIRQTKRDSVIRSTPQYSDYETSYLPFNTFNRYSPQNEQSYTGTTPYYGSDYVNSSPIPNRRTRPPTIIYLNEPEDRITTRKPIIQNFMSYTRPQSNNQKTSSKYESIVSSGGLSITQPTFSNSMSPPYSSKPLSQFNSKLPNAASTFSQIGSHYGGGTHVSSSAVSTGDFGSISGTATANGGDTSFSFNIRPKPGGGFQNIINSGKPTAGYYELPKPNIFSEYGNSSPLSKPQNNPDEDNSNEWSNQSPFSTASKRPHNDYYSRRPYDEIEQKEHKSTDLGDLYFSKIHRLDTTIDYDYDGKTFDTSDNNDTLIHNEENENEFDYYNEHTLDAHTGNMTEAIGKVKDEDDIFKPEMMALLLLQKKEKKRLNGSHLDDTYVLPLLVVTESSLEPLTKDITDDIYFQPTTDYINIVAKNSKTEILAEDDFETMAKKRETEDFKILVNVPASTSRVPFAPIRLLTKPERPDNWVLFDVSQEPVPLPELPDVWTESVSTIELPSPLRNLTKIWLSKLLKDPLTTELVGEKVLISTDVKKNMTTTDLQITPTNKMTDSRTLETTHRLLDKEIFKTTTPISFSEQIENKSTIKTFQPDEKHISDAPET